MSKKIPKNISKSPPMSVTGDFVFANQNLFLYKLVYGSTVSIGMVFLLLLSFFVQGVEKIYADELPTEVASEASEVIDTSLSEVITQTTETDALSVSSEITQEVVTQEDIPTEESNPSEETEVADELNETSTSTDEGEVNEDEETSEVTTPKDDESPEVSAEDDSTIASSTEESEGGVIDITENVTFEAVSVTQSDSEFSFNKDECTQLATGSFYCRQPQTNTLNDALFSAPDEDGDLEIFLVRGGVETQVTSNTMDDASPYFDQNTNTLVWHRLMDDRFQVISFDIESEQETQLTRTAENNMEPTRQGKYTVWQRWVDGGWNIVLFDGESETQITKTTSHNIAPYIHGSLVVWNRYTGTNEKTIEMYDIGSGTYVSVEDPDGMSVSNPRMVFVYDSLHPNGDIVTKGYDVLARKFIDLDTLPRDLPEDLPASDSTGETRALIQSKPSLKSDTEESLEGIATTSPGLLPGATTTEALTLDLTEPVVSLPVEPVPITTNFDLIIEPYIEFAEQATVTVQE